MKKLVISAVAASMASATALASESEWSGLDRDVQALSASVSGLESTGPDFGGYIRFAYLTSSDIEVAPGVDLGGFEVLEARLRATGKRGDVEYVLQAGFQNAFSANEGVNLEDAYVNIPIGSNLHVRAGQFRALVARDALVRASRLFFADRSEIGNLFEARNQGLALLGAFDAFDWAVTIQDGTDGDGDDYLIALRGEFAFLGDGVDMIEGSYGAPDQVEGTLAASYWDDGAVDDASGILVQATVAAAMYSVNVWFADIGDALSTPNALDPTAILLSADSTPFGITGTFMVTPATADQGGWELGVRFQDMDDANDTNVIDFGVNYYAAGHDYKYFLHYKTIDGDAGDADLIVLGLNVGF